MYSDIPNRSVPRNSLPILRNWNRHYQFTLNFLLESAAVLEHPFHIPRGAIELLNAEHIRLFFRCYQHQREYFFIIKWKNWIIQCICLLRRKANILEFAINISFLRFIYGYTFECGWGWDSELITIIRKTYINYFINYFDYILFGFKVFNYGNILCTDNNVLLVWRKIYLFDLIIAIIITLQGYCIILFKLLRFKVKYFNLLIIELLVIFVYGHGLAIWQELSNNGILEFFQHIICFDVIDGIHILFNFT